MRDDLYIVIMAGGIGSRFWPYSRNSNPKQFLDILGTGRSLLQMTYDRFLHLVPSSRIYVVTSQQYGASVQEHLPALTSDQIILEPDRRNTAPCIAYAAYKIRQKNPHAIMVVTPSDHVIFNDNVFYDAINTAVEAAYQDEKLITIGIKPTRPETGYGYIQYHDDRSPVKRVKTFTEKPQFELACTFIKSGDFVWNAGIFVWSIDSIVKAYEKYQPEMAEMFEEGKYHYFRPTEEAFVAGVYSLCKNISVDYAIMEAASNVYVVLGMFGWSDVGTWNSLHEIREKDEHHNVVDANALLYDCRNNYIKSKKNKLVILQDLDGYLVADFDDVLIVCHKDSEAKFREFYADAKSKKGEKYI